MDVSFERVAFFAFVVSFALIIVLTLASKDKKKKIISFLNDLEDVLFLLLCLYGVAYKDGFLFWIASAYLFVASFSLCLGVYYHIKKNQ